ncbi:Fmp40 [Kluyveromyces lactis]|nr:Fmp40 [Kluyveromyces lactis]
MADFRNIMQVLKECGTSRVVKHLEPERYLQSVGAAKELYQNKDEESMKRQKLVFHTPRPVTTENNGVPHFSFGVPEERPHYKFMAHSKKALEDLQLKSDSSLINICQGSEVYIDESREIFPYSLAYAGFQFGEFAGQLGDGRVLNLFDIKDKESKLQTVQLKGSGLTPYSRFADGKAVVRSSIREFLICESLHAIGIPSSRALQISSLPKTRARRSVFEPCAVITRFAPSWIRIGNFDLFRWKQDDEGLLKLADFSINHVFEGLKDYKDTVALNSFNANYFEGTSDTVNNKELRSSKVDDSLTNYDKLFRHIVTLNAECVAYWQAYGFCNGVLNTDNTSILGLSIDFGPFGFMDKFQPQYTPNHDDYNLRYSFANQPTVIWWNLVKLAEALVIPLGAGPSLIDRLSTTSRGEWKDPEIEKISKRATAIINLTGLEYEFRFTTKYADLMAKRLGYDLNIPANLTDDNLKSVAEKVTAFTSDIIEPILRILTVSGVDYNSFFLALQNYDGNFLDEGGMNGVDDGLYRVFFTEEQLKKINDYYIGQEQDDSGETRKLIEEAEVLSNWSKDYKQLISDYPERVKIAKQFNPLFIPRNYILESVANHYTDEQRNELNDPDAKLDNGPLQKLILMATNPYDKSAWDSSFLPELEKQWTNVTEDEDLLMTQCSCSS